MPERRPDGRQLALSVLLAVLDGGHTLDAAFGLRTDVSRWPDDAEAAREVALARELATTSLRHYFSLRGELVRHLRRPFEQLDVPVACLLLLGACQIRHARIPAYAAVSATVDLTTVHARGARGLVNAVLRRIAEGPAPPPHDDVARLDHPRWLIDALRNALGDDAATVFAINQGRAPLAVRVNVARTTRADFLAELAARGIGARAGRFAPAGVVFDAALPAARIPGLDAGLCTIQDEGAQLAACWLHPVAGERVLDACAAPGNKSTQILEQAPGVRLTALDASARRMDTLRAQIARQGVTAHTVVADATDVDAWWSGTPFDAILLDAPCSATGTLRRHPDIKVRLTAHDVDALCARQRALLTALWRTLAPGGRLVYCTCSLLPAENEQVIAHFLCEHPDAVLAPAPIDVGLDRGHGRLLLPQQDGPDGFFLALLRRQA